MSDGGKEEKGYCEKTVQSWEKGRLSFNQIQSFDYFIKLDTVNNSIENAFFLL